MPRIPCETDVELRGMLSVLGGHGVDCRLFRPDGESSCIEGIFEAPWNGIDGGLPGRAEVSMQAPTLLVEDCDVIGVVAAAEGKPGFEIMFGTEENYKIVDVQPEGTGTTLLVLQVASARR